MKCCRWTQVLVPSLLSESFFLDVYALASRSSCVAAQQHKPCPASQVARKCSEESERETPSPEIVESVEEIQFNGGRCNNHSIRVQILLWDQVCCKYIFNYHRIPFLDRISGIGFNFFFFAYIHQIQWESHILCLCWLILHIVVGSIYVLVLSALYDPRSCSPIVALSRVRQLLYKYTQTFVFTNSTAAQQAVVDDMSLRILIQCNVSHLRVNVMRPRPLCRAPSRIAPSDWAPNKSQANGSHFACLTMPQCNKLDAC